MMILVTYDIDTTSKSGASRLKKVAKKCQDYGVRVQNSVFECVVDTTQYTMLKHELLKIIDQEQDSLRFYRLGGKVFHKSGTLRDKVCAEGRGAAGFIAQIECVPQANISLQVGSHPKKQDNTVIYSDKVFIIAVFSQRFEVFAH